ncbi:MAG TPA: cytochrome c oxidase assembly protein [Solirubrobacteraceae bacterium]|jgi:cytochrome c oxidase assembly factor CtaG|nr:cytochrome c oxidase assembly protein [Solirubrobacteraceae bacterium]
MIAAGKVGGLVLAPAQLAPLLAIALLYARRVRTLAPTPRAVPGGRQACFYGGLGVILVAIGSPTGRIADELFSVHMAEHLLIGDIGALLLVLGLTGPLLAPILRTRWLGWTRALTHPVVAIALWAVDLYAWHAPALYQAAIRHDGIHALEHACFGGFGVAMWMALFGPLPKPTWFGNLAKLLYVIAVRLLGGILANVIIWDDHVLYPHYEAAERAWGISPHADQVAAGAVMMVEGSIVTICLFGWLFLRAAREGEERQELLDLAAAHGLELDERRAARAVAAGRGAELRERILAGRLAEPHG